MDGLVSRARMIRLSLQPAPSSEISAFNNIRAFNNRCADSSLPNKDLEPFAFPGAQSHNVLLYRNLLRRHDDHPAQLIAGK